MGQAGQGFGAEFIGQKGWRVVAAAMLGYGLGVSVLPSFTLGVFAKPLSDAFGWSQGEIQTSIVFITIATMGLSWVVAWAAERFGARRVTVTCQIGLALGFIFLSLAPNNLAVWYALWMVLAVLGIGTVPVIWTYGVTTWFDKGRGLALSITLTGMGFTALAAPPLLTMAIDLVGWRGAYVALAAMVLLVALPANLLLFSVREPVKVKAVSAPVAFKANRNFWILLVSTIAAGFGIGGMMPNVVPILLQRGLTPYEAAAYASTLGLCVIFGRIGSGYLLDRIRAPIVAFIFLSLAALACLALSSDAIVGWPIVVAVGLIGFATGTEGDLMAYLTSRTFDHVLYNKVYALIWSGFALTAGTSAPIFGYVYDLSGSYNAILYVSAALLIVSPILLFALGRTPAR
ncbi:MAG: MFS transporter [Rhodospirillaceae bacterium]|nr:MFS transporter [Rhodospirillaceae bacterium]